METIQIPPPASSIGQKIQLSLCDAYSPKVWVLQTHFWPLKGSTTPERVFQILKEGLLRTVAEVPALAGTVSHGASGDPRDLIISIGPTAHVEFSCEHLHGEHGIPSYHILESQGFPVTGLMAVFSPPILQAPVSTGAPIMVAKLNVLEGGVALYFGFNHLYVDAGAIAGIETIWAKHTADVSAGKEDTYRLSAPDEEIRQRLSNPPSDAGKFEDVHWEEFPTNHSQLNLPREPVTTEAALAALHGRKREQLSEQNAGPEQTNWAFWYFSADQLAKLKVQASGADDTKWISTMDALVGLFWSRLALLHVKDGKLDDISTLLFPINIRQRLQPPLPPQYLGNAVDIVFTECPLKELSGSDALAHAALCVREAVNSWSFPKWQAWQKHAISLQPDKAICPNPLCLLAPHNAAFNDYSKSSSNILDWGAELGCIDRTRYMKPASSVANCATAIIVNPRLPDGGLEVAVSCNAQVQHALEIDELFQTYCKLVCVSA